MIATVCCQRCPHAISVFLPEVQADMARTIAIAHAREARFIVVCGRELCPKCAPIEQAMLALSHVLFTGTMGTDLEEKLRAAPALQRAYVALQRLHVGGELARC